MPARRHQAVPQGLAVLRRQVRHRAAELSPGPARAVPDQAHELRHPTAREAEGQAHLRRAGEPVPPLLRHGRARARGHGREPAQAARAPAGQRGVPARHGRLATRGAPDGRARAHASQRTEGLHPLLHRAGGRGRADPPHLQDAGARGRQPRGGPGTGSRLARSGRQREERHRARSAHPGGHPDPGAGADDRRAVLQVGPARQGQEKGRHGTDSISEAEDDRVTDPEAPLPGVAESTQDVLLNLKKLAVNVPSGEAMVTRLDATGPRAVTGADVSEATGVEVLNPEIPIATLAAGASLSIELGIGVGRGYISADRHPAGTLPAGAMALDAAFSPIQRVSYNVENARLGKITDYDRLVVEVWTNGAVSPDEALTKAAAHMRDQFALLAPEGGEEEEEEVEGAEEGSMQDSLSKSLDDLPLPARAINALKNAELLVVADLVQKTDADLEQVKNLGDKSIDEIKTALAALGLSLGMRIDPNLLGTLGRGGTK